MRDPAGRGTAPDDSWMRRGAPFAVPVLVAAGLLILYYLLPVLEIVAFASLLALILRTFILWMGKVGVASWLAIIILFVLLAGSGIFVWIFVIPSLIQELGVLASSLPGYITALEDVSRDLHRTISFIPDLHGNLGQLQSYLSGILGSVPQLVSTATSLVVEAIATLVMALYMAHDPDSLIRGILRFVPRHREEEAKELIGKLEVRLRGWILGLILSITIIGLGAGLGLWILGIPLALTFGIIAGLLEIIPYFGQVLGAVLPALLALTVSPVSALLVIVLFIILNQIDDHLIQPLVMGREVNLHPVVVIVSFLAFGTLLGLSGVLLAVPAAAFLVTLVDEVTSGPKESPDDSPKGPENISEPSGTEGPGEKPAREAPPPSP